MNSKTTCPLCMTEQVVLGATGTYRKHGELSGSGGVFRSYKVSKPCKGYGLTPLQAAEKSGLLVK